MNPLVTHFPGLSLRQMEQFERLGALYREWNERINVISRKDMEELYTHHVLHSLSIGRFISFKPATRILDAGTGGGFPGVPLAILFPEASFILADSIGKKIRVVQAICGEIGLDNVRVVSARVESIRESFDFVVARAVTTLPVLYRWVKPLISREGFNDISNGLICLKGGELEPELKPFREQAQVVSVSSFFEEPYFEEKKIIFIPVC